MAGVTDPQQLLTWAGLVANDRVLALAMTRPGPVKFEVSSRVRFGSDGAAQRLWSPLYAEDGVVVSDLGQRVDPVVTVRVAGAGLHVGPARHAGRDPGAGATTAERDRHRHRHLPRARHPLPVARAAGRVRDRSPTWTPRSSSCSGAPPCPGPRKLALVLVTRDDGQRFQALVGQQGDAEFQAGVRPLPRRARATSCRGCSRRPRRRTRRCCCARPGRGRWSTGGRASPTTSCRSTSRVSPG